MEKNTAIITVNFSDNLLFSEALQETKGVKLVEIMPFEGGDSIEEIKYKVEYTASINLFHLGAYLGYLKAYGRYNTETI